MRVTVEDNAPGEVTAKLPEIVRQLLQLDACDHDAPEPLEKAWKPGDPDPLEDHFASPVTLAMYRKAKAAGDRQAALMVADVRRVLEGA